MTLHFRVDQRERYWTVEIFDVSDDSQDWLHGFEEPLNEEDYVKMAKWCETTFKTWLTPRRARRMSFNQFWFKKKADLDWFILYWSGVDI